MATATPEASKVADQTEEMTAQGLATLGTGTEETGGIVMTGEETITEEMTATDHAGRREIAEVDLALAPLHAAEDRLATMIKKQTAIQRPSTNRKSLDLEADREVHLEEDRDGVYPAVEVL